LFLFYGIINAIERKVVSVDKGKPIILLIDDEIYIREMSKRLFEKLGYDVILASNGAEGIEIYKNNLDEIDLVILDMVMPEMTGKDVYKILIEMNPDIKIVFLSGNSKEEVAEYMNITGEIDYIQKPYRLHEISQVLAKTVGN
jgi:CheY-like chemotaxis protein